MQTHRSAFAVTLALILAVAVPTTLAQTGTYGSTVPKRTPLVYALSGGAPDQFEFFDDDSDGVLDTGEVAYLTKGSGTVDPGDLRLTSGAGGANTRVTTSSSDRGRATTPLAGTLSLLDLDASGGFTDGDRIYYDLAGAGAGTVSVRDVILAGAGSGALVSASSPSLNSPLVALGSSIAYYDKDADGVVDTTEPQYLDNDGDGRVTVNDARLGPSGTGGAPGSAVKIGDADVTYVLQPVALDMVFLDDGSPLSASSSTYLSTGAGSLASADVRTANPPVSSIGSQVRPTSTDRGKPATSLGGGLAFLDANANGVYNVGEALYWDRGDANAGKVSLYDVGLLGTNKGRVLTASASGINSPLVALTASIAYFDANGGGSYGIGDVLILDLDGDGFASQNDIQLSDPKLTSGGSSGGGGGSPGGVTTPPSITITRPAADAYVGTGQTISVAGTANAGAIQGTASAVQSVALTVNGASISVTTSGSGQTVSWSTLWTPPADGTYTLTATVTTSDTTTATTTHTVTANEAGAEAPATRTCDDGSTVPADQECPTVDPEARESAEDAKEAAQEAKDAADRAEEKAQEAADAAGQARDVANENNDILDQIARQLDEGGGESGTPAPGALVLVALLGLGAVALRRRR